MSFLSSLNMNTRRCFLKTLAAAAAALCLPASLPRKSRASDSVLKTRNPKRALVLWYSQTGQTRRYARLIGCILKEKGLTVAVRNMQEFDKNLLPDYDLVVMGTPVFYYDTPSNIRDWLETIPPITGTPVAAFVSFGGPEGNQHNASTHILKLLVTRAECLSEGTPSGMSHPIQHPTGTTRSRFQAGIFPMRQPLPG